MRLVLLLTAFVAPGFLDEFASAANNLGFRTTVL